MERKEDMFSYLGKGVEMHRMPFTCVSAVNSAEHDSQQTYIM